jgi:hypothetical protein
MPLTRGGSITLELDGKEFKMQVAGSAIIEFLKSSIFDSNLVGKKEPVRNTIKKKLRIRIKDDEYY